MKVSQYIYTACGKDRNGAFSVFSKSKDITDEESSEIREIMMYKSPPGLSFEPTDQEIEEKFPKKFGYFLLTSGRACLAQVCYVGRVYSDLDTRWGNYIIHAFVFKKKPDFSPYSFIEHEIFKKGLTKKEWHDDPIPDDLPQIDIPDNGSMLSAGDISSFFNNEERWNKLAALIESAISATPENSLNFNDDHKNCKYWIKALSLCLPKEMQNNTSLCSHFTNTIVPGNVSSRVLIRINRPESGQYSYPQEAQRGNFAFDFIKNITPSNLSPKKYAQTIVKLTKAGPFEAIKFVDSINKVMSEYKVNINEASDLINLHKEDYSEFDNVENFYDTIMLADRAGYETKSIAEKLTAKKHSFSFNSQQQLSVYAFVYKNISSINTRVSIIKIILSNADKLGISSSGAVVLRDELKSKAGFIFENYYDYLKSEKGLTDYITQNSGSFAKLFVAFDHLAGLPALKSACQAKKFSGTEETQACKSIMESAFKRNSSQDLDILIKSADSNVSGLGIEWLCIIVKNSMSAKPASVQFAFEILRRLQPKKESAYEYLLYLIKNSSGQEEFIKMYVNAEKDNKEFFTRFENDNKTDPLIKDFAVKKDAYSFTYQTLSVQALKDYFNKYYVKGADSGLFVKRLNEYIRSIQPEKKANECIALMDAFKFPPEAEKYSSPVITAILDAVFSLPYEEIWKLMKKQEISDKLTEAYNKAAKESNNLKQDTVDKINVVRYGKIIEKYDFKTSNDILTAFYSKTQTDYDDLSAIVNKIDSKNNFKILIDNHFAPVVNLLIFGATIGKNFDYEGILEKAFGKIIEKGAVEELVKNVDYGVSKSKAKTVEFILFLFRKHLASSNKPLDKKLGDIAEKYFETISQGERKKRFAELLDKADEKEKKPFMEFFEEFNKKHKTGFFDIFKKK